MCFLIGATGPGVTATGEAVLGSGSDDPYLFRTVVRVVQPSKGYCHVGTELVYATQEDLEPPFHVVEGETTRGVNSAGLSFVIALAVPRVSTFLDHIYIYTVLRYTRCYKTTMMTSIR